MDPVERLTRRWERERKARKEAERVLERKSLELYRSNLALQAVAVDLKEKEERSRSILEAAADGIVTLDDRGRIESINPAALAVFACTEREAVGRAFNEYLDCSSGSACSGDIRQAADNRGEPLEVRGRRRDGTVFPMELTVSSANLGRRSIRILLLRDITERKRAEAERSHMEIQLRQAQKLEAIGQLAAGIAHEINTPTQFVSDNVRFLQEAFDEMGALYRNQNALLEEVQNGGWDDTLPARLAAAAGEVDLAYLQEEIPLALSQSLEGLERIARIVRAMKEFSHPGSEEKRPADINSALLSTVEISRNEWKYHAELLTELDPDLPRVPCLPGELNQVFLNIIVNAAHAIEESADSATQKGRIHICTRRTGAAVEIAISDTGPGIPEAILPRIFDPFFTTKEVGRGSGQGLAIAYAVVVEKHGGSIRVENPPQGGACFVISLPLATTP